MILAIKAPQGSSIRVPSEAQIKEMHTLALKENKRGRAHDPNTEADSILTKEDNDDLLNYLSKKYQVFIGAGVQQTPIGKENQEED
jgi:hypothetical protein